MSYQLRFLLIACVKLSLLAVAGLVSASEIVEDPPALAILDELKASRTDMNFGELRTSTVDGYYEIQAGALTLYVAESGDHFFVGELISISDGQIISETEKSKAAQRVELLAQLDRNDMIVFAPQGETRAVLTVFTDVTCTYCRALHREIDDLNAAGIEVHYLAWPRTGLGTYEALRTTTAWCAEDRNRAMTELKADTWTGGDDICANNPVADQYELGVRLGVTGTPAIVLEDGVLMPGYRTVDQFVEILGLEE